MPKSHWIGKTSAAGPNLVLRVELGPAKLSAVTEGLSDYFWKARPVRLAASRAEIKRRSG